MGLRSRKIISAFNFVTNQMLISRLNNYQKKSEENNQKSNKLKIKKNNNYKNINFSKLILIKKSN